MRDIKYNNKNKTYYDIVKDILEHDEFLKLKKITHHGLNRYEHNKRVSYYSYLVAKILRLDYESVARAGALHDFFHDANKETKITEKIDLLERHPRYSLENSKMYFDLNEKEKNIILSHMFPVVPKYLPKYLESWIVDIVDDWVGIGERIYSTRKGIIRFANILFIIFLYR